MNRDSLTTLTPLGAAIFEALPDTTRVKLIQRRFEKCGECPVSKIFDAAAVERFYLGQDVKAVSSVSLED